MEALRCQCGGHCRAAEGHVSTEGTVAACPCREAGETKVILIALSGHGHMVRCGGGRACPQCAQRTVL